MTEHAPKETNETFKSARPLELVDDIEDPITLRTEDGEQTTRFQEADEAHGVANNIDAARDMLIEARQDLEAAYAAKKSPLVEKNESKVRVAEINFNANSNVIPRTERLEEAARKRAEDYDKAA